MNSIKNYFILITTFLSGSSFAQTGLADIGNSASNVFWVKSEDITSLVDGGDIARWTDFSGNGRDLSQPITTLTPEFQ